MADSVDPRPVASIADPYLDLLQGLSYGQRQGLVQRLATGYYDGWRPSRIQVAELIAGEGGWLTDAERHTLFERARAPQDPAMIVAVGRPVAQERQERSPTVRTMAQTAVTPADRAAATAGPRNMLPFTALCGPLAPRTEFVARGLSSGPWITRASRVCRLISLHYEVVLRPGTGQLPQGVGAFTGTILCQPDVSAPPEPGDGDSSRHTIRSGRVIGVRGAWPISARARRVGFVLYPESTGEGTERHPAGTLLVDLTSNRAMWSPRLPDIEPVDAREPLAGHG